MSEGLDELCRAGATLLNSVAKALDSHTELQKRRLDYALQQTTPAQDKPFDEFQPGYFEKQLTERQRKTG